MVAPKKSVNATKKDRVRGAVYAEGGDDKMFKPQSSGTQQSGITGKNQTKAPGALRARGGPKNVGYGLSLPAVGGHTAPVKLGKGR
jgi:hypothetical protein